MAEDTCLVMNDTNFASHGGVDSEVQRMMPVDVEALDPFVLGDGFPLHMSSHYYTRYFSPPSQACTSSSLFSLLSTNTSCFLYSSSLFSTNFSFISSYSPFSALFRLRELDESFSQVFCCSVPFPFLALQPPHVSAIISSVHHFEVSFFSYLFTRN